MSGILKSVFLFFLLFSGSELYADDYIISLKDLQVTSLLKGYYVERVINATKEESCIGFVKKGMFNRQEPAMMQPTMAVEVENCLKRSFPHSSSDEPLVIRINHLYIYEITGSQKEIACIDLSVSFVTKDSSGYIEQFIAGDSFERSGLDVTGFHADNLVQALGDCFDDFCKATEYGKLHPQMISEMELFQNPLDHPDRFEIFRRPQISRGLFKSFYTFRDCHPDTITTFAVKYRFPKKDSAHVRASLDLPPKLSQKDYYGFSDGNNIFVWAGSGFAVASRKDKSISLRVDRNDVKEGASSGVYMAGLLGGMVGGLLAGLASGVTAASAEGSGTCTVDFSSGRLIPSNIPDYLKTESNTILFLSKASATGTGLTIISGGDTLCLLKPGNYLKLSLPSKYHELKILMTGKDCISREETIPARLFNTDLYILKVKNNKEITVTTAYEQVKKDLLNGMTDENTIVRRDLLQKPPVN